MLRNSIITLIIISLIVTLSFSYSPKQQSTTQPLPSNRQIAPFAELPAVDGIPPAYMEPSTDDAVGDVFLLGTTWYDIQHNTTCGRQIHADYGGWIHVVWMNGLNNGASLRHIYYQLMDTNDAMQFIGGVQVDQGFRGGYTDLELHPDGRSMPCFHQSADMVDWHTVLGFDYFPRTGAFQAIVAPRVYQGGTPMVISWPKVAKDINDRYHIISTEATADPGLPQQHYYIGATFNPGTYTIDFDAEQIPMATTMTISSTVAASPVSGRVAIAYLEPWATAGDTTQHDNNLIIVTSDDGQEWDWSDTLNITDWIPPDFGLLPDTLLANQDTLRCYAEINLLFDYNDELHVFFTTEGFYSLEGTITWGNGFIWHWSENWPYYALVANGWYENGFYDPGAWNTYTTRPQAAVDPATGDLYCMYQRYAHPLGASTTLPFPYQLADTTDFSLAGWPNGEIWVTRSGDGGASWYEGKNVTNSWSPDAASGQCMSELTPSMHQEVVNDNLHIFYIMDKDAGAVVQAEGGWTQNDAVYHRVPIDSIPYLPILPRYPMHCDSTGFPPEISVADNGDLTPVEFTLDNPYPNPFNQRVALDFMLPAAANIHLAVYDITGREVAALGAGHWALGKHSVPWNAEGMSSGIYFVRLTVDGGQSAVKKMVLMK